MAGGPQSRLRSRHPEPVSVRIGGPVARLLLAHRRTRRRTDLGPLPLGPPHIQRTERIFEEVGRSDVLRNPGRDLAAQVRQTSPPDSAAESRPTSSWIHSYP